MEVKIFRISDLVQKRNKNRLSDDPLKKRTLLAKKYRHHYAKRGGVEPTQSSSNTQLEPSAFKISNQFTVHGTPKIKRNRKKLATCDVLQYHNDKVKYFRKLKESLPEKINELENAKLSDRQKRVLKREIKEIEEGKEEKEYNLATRKILEDYEKSDTLFEKDDSEKGILKYVVKYENTAKQILAEEYCRATNNGLMINRKRLEFSNTSCEHCEGQTESVEGYITCIDCGLVSSKTIQDFQVSYKDLCDTNLKGNFSYKRINRFKEVLATLQAKENTNIPVYIIDSIRKEIEKEQNFDLNMVDIKKIKYYLKRLSLTSYYDHAPNILRSIVGTKSLDISEKVEEKMLEMFSQIQDPFERAKKKVKSMRKSFLSYPFVMIKFCELLSLDDTKEHFTLLKSSEKLKLHDKIWFEIVNELGWKYIPTI